jgi:hypothetical protein
MNDSPPTDSTKNIPPLPVWARASLIYLFLPLVVFVMGWLKPWIAILLLLLIILSVGSMVRRHKSLPRFSSGRLHMVAVVTLIAIGLVFLTGLWPGLPQSNDYLKHNLIIGDLAGRSWPVRYPGVGGGEYLCYGLGHYMIPGAIAKLCGPASVGIAGFMWATTGVFLFLLGLARFFPRNAPIGILLVLLASGLGTFWYLIKTGLVHSLMPMGFLPDIPDFLHLGLFTSNLDSFTRMFYQPQHCLAGWLSGLLIYELLVVRKMWAESASVIAATSFWSPLTAVGLGVIGLAVLCAEHRTLVFRPLVHLVAALAIMGIMTAFYLPHLPIMEKGFIWDLSGDAPWLIWYFLFVLFFVLIPATAVYWLEWNKPYLGSLKPVMAGALLLLLASPLYKLGYFGDLRMQISGPAFLFVAIAMTRGLLLGPSEDRMVPFLFLCAVFLGGAIVPLIRTYENMIVGARTDFRIETLRNNELDSIKDLRMTGFDVTSQYLGRSDAPSARWLLKDNHSNPDHK